MQHDGGIIAEVSHQKVGQIELGKANLSLETMVRMALAVDRDLISLMG
jgi:hypothetical protein